MARTAKAIKPQDLSDALQRDAQLKKTQAELLRAIFNRAGVERLRNITDREWTAAQDADSNQGKT